MRLLVFSDIHGDRAALARLMEVDADYYIAAGDLVSWGRGLDAIGPVLALRAPRVWVLPGNHEHEKDIEQLCRQFQLNPLHGKTFPAGPYTVAGLGYSNPTPFDTPGEYSESQLGSRLDAFAGISPMILVCHCPPKGTALDEARPGLHVGSTAVAQFLAANQPEWFFCGHIHEAEGRSARIGKTTAINAGKRGWLLEL